MPNTLGHIAFQTLSTRVAFRRADVKWIYVGCVLPDVPWILRRIVDFLSPGIDAIELRYYVDVQGSLPFLLVAAASIALFTRHYLQMFGLLAGNVVLHLILDAAQTKWGNGVHFFAPFSWQLTNWGWFWPDGLVDLALSAAGLIVLIVMWKPTVVRPSTIWWPPDIRLYGALALISIYFLLPVAFMHGPEEADNHYFRTLMLEGGRVGQYVEFDRIPFEPTSDGGEVRIITGETIRLQNVGLVRPETVSLRGNFSAPGVLWVTDIHIHAPWLRDGASLLGLGLFLAVWLHYGFRSHLRRKGRMVSVLRRGHRRHRS